MGPDPIGWPRAANFDGKGPRSLVAMCLRGLAKDLTETEAYIPLDDDSIPEALLLRLLREVQLRYHKEIPLHSWKILSKACWSALARDAGGTPWRKLPKELLFHRRTIRQASDDLQTYLKEYRSPAPELKLESTIPDFLVSLTIDSVTSFQPHHLLSLATLNNLVHLHIVSERPDSAERGHVTDSLFRGWSETSNAFPMLQTLRVTNSQALSYRSVQLVTVFPCLLVYEVLVHYFPSYLNYKAWGDIAKSHGWRIKVVEPSLLSMVPTLEQTLSPGADVALPSKPLASLELVGQDCNPNQQLLDYVKDLDGWRLYRQSVEPGIQSGAQNRGNEQDSDRKDQQPPQKRKRKDARQLRAGKSMRADDMLSSFGIPRSGGP
ncbi:hypothetical protein QBC34DRAFT_384619 [Podospora aff. communis PSN243]|uniref:F-box domain-containing protein n=1 Tax=Podospora aff. communis PSN243 TaxID=3040156 RepID=A0AAV9GCD5_9PEZI|nr:hypothetical protein QBC34DRAFT_384619 [Podospora aff. communis PSN243]